MLFKATILIGGIAGFLLIIKLLKHIIMTQAEATDKINTLTTQLGKVKTEVQKLIDAVQTNGNVTPELETAILNAQTALQGVDDLNQDEVVTE